MKFFESTKQRLEEWSSKRREKAAERRAQKRYETHHDSRFWLLSIPAAATLCAAFVEVYWAILFCIEATGYIDWNFEGATGSETPASSTWNVGFSAHLPVLVGLVAATVPIVMWSMVWLPVQMKARGKGRWRRLTMIVTGLLANALVIISGTVVMNYNRQDQVRETLVVEQTAAQGRAAIDARLAFEQEQLRLALNNSNPYLNQAANVGAAEWERSYVAQARAINDPRLPMLERALGAARAADERRANIERLTVERATAAPEAASAANVEDTVGVGLNTFAQYAEVYRPPFVALICTIIGIFGAWWWVGLAEAMDRHNVSLSGWAPEDRRIEDLREEEAVAPQPMKPAREVVTDAETGEELVKVKPREYWRKRKGKPQKLDIQPEIPPDETGVEYDGGARTASALVDVIEQPPEAVAEPQQAAGEGENEQDQQSRDLQSNVHEEPPLVSEQEAAEALAELELAASDDPASEIAEATETTGLEPEGQAARADENVEQEIEGEEPVHNESPEREEPETDPGKLIAAE